MTTYSMFSLFTAPPTTTIYTLSLHDALPISSHSSRSENQPTCAGREETHETCRETPARAQVPISARDFGPVRASIVRSEEHTSELQSPYDLVCRLLLEKKKTIRELDKDQRQM